MILSDLGVQYKVLRGRWLSWVKSELPVQRMSAAGPQADIDNDKVLSTYTIEQNLKFSWSQDDPPPVK